MRAVLVLSLHSPKTRIKLMTPETIKSIRTALGDTQTQFAERIGKKLRQVQKYESGFTPVPVTVEKLIAAIVAQGEKE